MRIHPPCLTRARKTLTVLGVAGFVIGSAMLGFTGSAAAVTAETSCEDPITGKVAETVYLNGKSVEDIVRKAAQERKTGVDYVFVQPDWVAEDIAKEKALQIGTVPNAPSGSIKGEVIGAAVRKALEDANGLGGDKEGTLDHIAKRVSEQCGLPLRVSNYVAPPTTTNPSTGPGGTGSTPGAAGPQAPGTTADPWGLGNYGSGDARAPRRDYSGLPSAMPGVSPLDRYGVNSAPGATPEFGVLGATGGETEPSVQNAGNADPLAQEGRPDAVQLPMLLAVVALAGVTAALVRTWVLGRV